MKQNPLILEIKGNSLDDGPGIRSVVFFKGCPLSCIWCHNPESKKAGPEISFDPGECVDCGTCSTLCPAHALSKENPFFVDRKKCALCFDCVQACPSGALEQVGQALGIWAMLDQVARDKPFYDTSGGGVTFSGGEPTLSMNYLGKAAAAMQEKGIQVLIETCGHFNIDRFMDQVYPHTDLIYFDIKLMDPADHKTYCGCSNEKILSNFKALYQNYRTGGIEVLPRIPLIPGITALAKNIEAIISMFKQEKVTQTQLMPYHPVWMDKPRKIGMERPQLNVLNEWMPQEEIKACEAMFIKAGISVNP